ncbi:hypothetical protein CC2G_003831 [Coprinopsis cinerea AmutBmut pab1-1]|nr:hypothetical protein CC2G_003831 [Coprinopsis cinerea AmutBmut pab1-1]
MVELIQLNRCQARLAFSLSTTNRVPFSFLLLGSLEPVPRKPTNLPRHGSNFPNEQVFKPGRYRQSRRASGFQVLSNLCSLFLNHDHLNHPPSVTLAIVVVVLSPGPRRRSRRQATHSRLLTPPSPFIKFPTYPPFTVIG